MEHAVDIKALREARGWTQQEMADAIGVNLSTIWRWENVRPPRGAARKLIEAMASRARSSDTGAAA